ncbi:MAG: T9SS type A sorting domain-containing protein [Bacteroidota bacterium]
MKKIYLSIILSVFVSCISFAQTVLFVDNFTTYDSLSGANYNGWNLTYTGFTSYYTSTQSSGLSGPNSYKFGRDSATAITPMFSASADSIHFWMKGNSSSGGTMAQSTFYIYESSDGTNWSPLTTLAPPITLVGGYVHFGLSPGTVRVKFFYDKDTGNVAFDDFSVTSSTVGVSEVNLDKKVKLYPTPTSNKLNIDFGGMVNNANFTLINVIGKEVFQTTMTEPADSYVLNIGGFSEGIYFLKIKSNEQSLTKRIIIKH